MPFFFLHHLGEISAPFSLLRISSGFTYRFASRRFLSFVVGSGPLFFFPTPLYPHLRYKWSPFLQRVAFLFFFPSIVSPFSSPSPGGFLSLFPPRDSQIRLPLREHDHGFSPFIGLPLLFRSWLAFLESQPRMRFPFFPPFPALVSSRSSSLFFPDVLSAGKDLSGRSRVVVFLMFAAGTSFSLLQLLFFCHIARDRPSLM